VGKELETKEKRGQERFPQRIEKTISSVEGVKRIKASDDVERGKDWCEEVTLSKIELDDEVCCT